MNGQSFLKGAIIISVGGIIAKLLGAFYRIPLTNLLGGEGIGVYQMVYPLYCLLLTVSATGIPSGLAREISSARATGNLLRDRGVFLRSLTLFSFIGLFGVVLMFIIAPIMSRAQGETMAITPYRALAPSVFFVSVISCFRGYFQGQSNFTPTALSEIIEQAVKVGFGLFFAYRFQGDALKGVTYALFAVTLSEIFALGFMFFYYLFNKKEFRKPLFKIVALPIKSLSVLKITVPVTLISAILPLSNILDSIIIVNSLSRYTDNSTALYGLFSGGVNTIINLPTSICYGLAAAIIPVIATSYALKNYSQAETKVAFALKCTMYIAVPAAAFLFVFATPTINLIFKSLSPFEKSVSANLLKICAFSAFLFPCVHTLSACLTGRSKPLISALFLAISVIVKLILEIILLKFEKISIAGAAISQVACYFVAFALDLLYIIKDAKNFLKILSSFIRMAITAIISVFVAFPFIKYGAILPFFICVVVYIALSLLLGVFTKEELKFFKRRKHDKHSRARG